MKPKWLPGIIALLTLLSGAPLAAAAGQGKSDKSDKAGKAGRSGKTARAAKAEDLAQRAAESWLKRADAGKYGEIWEQSAAVFKGVVPRARWEESISSIRQPLGRLSSRKLQSRKYLEALSGAPEGKYVVVNFDTVFENKPWAVETVTATLDTDGIWRVFGYSVL